MRSSKILRLIAITLMALVLLVSSFSLLFVRRGDRSSGRVAITFIDKDRFFPQTDYSQLFSDLDIASYYHIDGEHLTKDAMNQTIDRAKEMSGASEVILVCEGSYALDGLLLSGERSEVKNCILMTPVLAENADLSTLGLQSPSCHVGIFSSETSTAGLLYEHLSGEDTKFTPGIKSDEQGMSLYLSPDAMRYYACYKSMTKSTDISASITLNHPVVQTYLSNYLMNYTLNESGVSRGPLGYWSIKFVCTILLFVAFFLYAATLPAEKKKQESSSKQDESAKKDPSPIVEETERRPAKLKNRTIFQKYAASQNHLVGLLLLVAALFTLVAVLCVAKKPAGTKPVLLVWIWASYMISAFFMLSFMKKVPKKASRKNRSMWILHTVFTILLIADIFMVSLLWRGAGFLTISLLHVVAVLLAIMLGVGISMLQITDSFFSEGKSNKRVLESLKFCAIRFVPMVIVFSFSFIMRGDISVISVVILSCALLLSEYLRRTIRKGALGDVLSVVLFSCLYWMMF